MSTGCEDDNSPRAVADSKPFALCHADEGIGKVPESMWQRWKVPRLHLCGSLYLYQIPIGNVEPPAQKPLVLDASEQGCLRATA